MTTNATKANRWHQKQITITKRIKLLSPILQTLINGQSGGWGRGSKERKRKMNSATWAVLAFSLIMVALCLGVFILTRDWFSLGVSYFFLAIGFNYVGYMRGVSYMDKALKDVLKKS